MAQGAITGAAAGPVIGGLTKAVDLARGFYGGIRPEVAALADTARQYGVTPPVTSLTTNPFLRQVSDALQKLPFSGADAGALAKQRQFQSAWASRMGSTADNLTPATMKETADRLEQGLSGSLRQRAAHRRGTSIDRQPDKHRQRCRPVSGG